MAEFIKVNGNLMLGMEKDFNNLKIIEFIKDNIFKEGQMEKVK